MAGKVNQEPSEEDKKRELYRLLGVASLIGINLVVCIFTGFAIGYWVLDKFFNTYPWFTIIFFILGMIAGFRYLFRIALKVGSNMDSKE